MSTIQLCVFGACGKMGQTIVQAGEADLSFAISALLDRPDHPRQNQPLHNQIVLSADPLSVLAKCECIIDFSCAPASNELVDTLLSTPDNQQLPALVIGTTGQGADFADKLNALSQRTALLFSPNMSIGVNLCYHLVAEAARIAGAQADIEITEAHHRNKIDAPSGTALELGRLICQQLGQDLDETAVYERYGQTGARQQGSIGFSTIRAGDIVGEHNVLFALNNELIQIKHTALSRENFANGALVAAAWLTRQASGSENGRRAPGLYGMADVLNLKRTSQA